MEVYFSGTQRSSILGVWKAPGAPDTIPKGGALRAPTFGVVSEVPGTVQTQPPKSMFSGSRRNKFS